MLTLFNVQVYIFVSVIFEDKTQKRGKYVVSAADSCNLTALEKIFV